MTKQTSISLKNCPFCGSNAEVVFSCGCIYRDIIPQSCCRHGYVEQVRCINWECEALIDNETPIEAWERRI
jgi:hypothetical protein